MKKVGITDTTLRDGHQSLWATRMQTEDMLPIVEKMDNAGFHSMEVWGGATFDVCLRYLGEDPWERLRTLKRYIKKTPLQMLLRAQSLVGYQHYPDDVVERFIVKAVENGIDIIRIFDALNDFRNMEIPVKIAKREGAHVQGTVVYTISPVHTMDHYLETAMKLEDMGVDSICIKDMAGLLSPYKAYTLVKLLKEHIKLPIQLHCHYIGGLAVGAYIKAAEAGVDVVDTASVPLAFGASQPPVETVVRALSETEINTGLNIHDLFEIAHYFEELRKKRGFERGVTRITDIQVFEHQVPGGMISNLVSQLKEQKAAHRMQDVLEEIPKVREDLGYPPLVTPTSQIVGTQAVLNVLTGERYKIVPGEVKAYVKGLYGKPPVKIKEDVRRKIIGDESPISGRPADFLEPKMSVAEREIGNLARSEEDVISYALFPQVSKKFLKARKEGTLDKLREEASDLKSKGKQDNLESKGEKKPMNIKDISSLIKILEETGITEINLESDGVKLNIKRGSTTAKLEVTPEINVEKNKEKTKEATENLVEVKAPMVGTFYRAPAPDAPPFVEVGDKVKKGQTLCIIETMKLMNEIESEINGTIVEITVENGQPIEYGDIIFKIREE